MPPSLQPGTRWHALDVFRGFVVSGMILVNAADLHGHAYAWLQHTRWDGCTFADTVFPGFLFIMGVAMGVSLHGAVLGGLPLRRIYPRIVRRTLLLFGLGLLLNGFFMESLEELRIMGVLQRLALCYALAAVILLHVSERAQIALSVAILIGHALLLQCVKVATLGHDASPITDNLAAYIDRAVLGSAHLLRSEPYLSQIDPEGLLGTLPATVNVLFGALAGRLLARWPVSAKTSWRLAGLGALGLALGFGLSRLVPINKALWTSSFALVTSGIAALELALCYLLVDVYEVRGWSRPFEVMGLNAIAAYLISTAIDAAMLRAQVQMSDGPSSLYELWLDNLGLAPAHAAFAFAALHVCIVWAIAQALHARQLYLKV
jgi:predicted acyltransferase